MTGTSEDQIDLSSIKSVSVISSDPYATDSSSSEDESISGDNLRRPTKPKQAKRFITKICVPTLIKRYGNLNLRKRNPKTSSGFKGVQLRSSGKFTAQVRDPFKKKRKWLGTFTTGEEASQVYEKTKKEFAERLSLGNQTGLVKPKIAVGDLSKPCGLSKPKGKGIALEKTFGFGFGFGCDYEEEEGMIGRMLEDPLMTLSISDICGESVGEPKDIWLEYDAKEFNSFLEESKFEFAEKSNYKARQIEYNMNEDNSNVIQREDIVSERAIIFKDTFVESTDDTASESVFDLITNDLELENFQLPEDFYDFGSFGKLDDDAYSWFNGTNDSTDMGQCSGDSTNK